MVSTEGGMDIEDVAEKTPEKIHKRLLVDIDTGVSDCTDAADVSR